LWIGALRSPLGSWGATNAKKTHTGVGRCGSSAA